MQTAANGSSGGARGTRKSRSIAYADQHSLFPGAFRRRQWFPDEHERIFDRSDDPIPVLLHDDSNVGGLGAIVGTPELFDVSVPGGISDDIFITQRFEEQRLLVWYRDNEDKVVIVRSSKDVLEKALVKKRETQRKRGKEKNMLPDWIHADDWEVMRGRTMENLARVPEIQAWWNANARLEGAGAPWGSGSGGRADSDVSAAPVGGEGGGASSPSAPTPVVRDEGGGASSPSAYSFPVGGDPAKYLGTLSWLMEASNVFNHRARAREFDFKKSLQVSGVALVKSKPMTCTILADPNTGLLDIPFDLDPRVIGPRDGRHQKFLRRLRLRMACTIDEKNRVYMATPEALERELEALCEDLSEPVDTDRYLWCLKQNMRHSAGEPSAVTLLKNGCGGGGSVAAVLGKKSTSGGGAGSGGAGSSSGGGGAGSGGSSSGSGSAGSSGAGSSSFGSSGGGSSGSSGGARSSGAGSSSYGGRRGGSTRRSMPLCPFDFPRDKIEIDDDDYDVAYFAPMTTEMLEDLQGKRRFNFPSSLGDDNKLLSQYNRGHLFVHRTNGENAMVSNNHMRQELKRYRDLQGKSSEKVRAKDYLIHLNNMMKEMEDTAVTARLGTKKRKCAQETASSDQGSGEEEDDGDSGDDSSDNCDDSDNHSDASTVLDCSGGGGGGGNNEEEDEAVAAGTKRRAPVSTGGDTGYHTPSLPGFRGGVRSRGGSVRVSHARVRSAVGRRRWVRPSSGERAQPSGGAEGSIGGGVQIGGSGDASSVVSDEAKGVVALPDDESD